MCAYAIRALLGMEAANEYMVTLAQEIFQMRIRIEVDENCTAQIEWNDGDISTGSPSIR
jgi:hypothetical protein